MQWCRFPNSLNAVLWHQKTAFSPSRFATFSTGVRPHVYRVLFTIEEETVYILHVRHGRRQPLKH